MPAIFSVLAVPQAKKTQTNKRGKKEKKRTPPKNTTHRGGLQSSHPINWIQRNSTKGKTKRTHLVTIYKQQNKSYLHKQGKHWLKMAVIHKQATKKSLYQYAILTPVAVDWMLCLDLQHPPRKNAYNMFSDWQRW